MCTAALTCVSDICVMFVNVFTCGGERYDLSAVAEVSAESGEGLSVEETEPAGSRSSVHPFFLTEPRDTCSVTTFNEKIS
ncbi:uncharacterized [Tachysurus ichikawai]